MASLLKSACEVFFDPLAQGMDAGVEDEARSAAIGETGDWRLLIVVHIVRDDNWIRIISARPADAKERKVYEDDDGTD